jgi:predicted AAA+ superfamily ATPase
MPFFRDLLVQKQLNKNEAFIWDSQKKKLKSINDIKTINLDLIVGVEEQKKTILKNTQNFSSGNFTNNALLWGARGNGKSTLIKAIFQRISKKNKYLKILQLNKNSIMDIEEIYSLLSRFYKYRFIIFIDDLSFEKIDSEYKIIKSTLDGSIQHQPKNIVLYVTSNRRHLMPREMIDNERSSAIHTDESVEEKISLSDRFGLWIGFHNLSQNDFLDIIKGYCNYYNIEYNDKTKALAIKWSLQRGNRTGRTGWQFILQLAADYNLKLDF